MADSSKKIFWTSEETDCVCKRAAEIALKDPRQSMKRVLQDAQRILPAHRQRPLHASAVARLSAITRGIMGRVEEERRRAEELPAPLPETTPDSIIEDLADTIGNAFAELFSQALRTSMARVKQSLEQPTQPARKRLPKLTIVGLLPSQKNEIETEFGSIYDLRFWKDESPHTLKSLTRSSDAVICMKDWVAHGHTGLVQSVDPKKLRIVPGTVSNLRNYLSAQRRTQ